MNIVEVSNADSCRIYALQTALSSIPAESFGWKLMMNRRTFCDIVSAIPNEVVLDESGINRVRGRCIEIDNSLSDGVIRVAKEFMYGAS